MIYKDEWWNIYLQQLNLLRNFKLSRPCFIVLLVLVPAQLFLGLNKTALIQSDPPFLFLILLEWLEKCIALRNAALGVKFNRLGEQYRPDPMIDPDLLDEDEEDDREQDDLSQYPVLTTNCTPTLLFLICRSTHRTE